MNIFSRGKKAPTENAPIKVTGVADALALDTAVDHWTHDTWNDTDIQIILNHMIGDAQKAEFLARVAARLANIEARAVAMAHADAAMDDLEGEE